MSKWTDFRDEIIKQLNFDKIDEELKQQFSNWLLVNLLPAAEEAANKFTAQTKEQAKTETGWVKFRDLIVLPFIIDGGLWLVKTTLTKTITEVEKLEIRKGEE